VLIGDRWEESKAGALRIFKKHDHGQQYVIGADVGHGVSTSRKHADWSVAQVLDESGEQVALMRSRVLPGDFSRWLYHLGRFYNDAEICVENAGPGYHVCQRLSRDYLYPNFYTEEVFDKISEQTTTKLGFTTSVKSKPMIINKLRDAVAASDIKVNDPDTLDEMRTFIVTDSGKYEADAGAHDDTIIALALAWHIHKGEAPEAASYALWDVEEGSDPDAGGDLFDNDILGIQDFEDDDGYDGWNHV
jgi:hypothetical protein